MGSGSWASRMACVLVMLNNVWQVQPREIYLPSLVSASGTSDIQRNEVLPSGISRQQAQKQAVNKTLIVTWANVHYLDFARNFARHMKRLKLSNYLIGAMDQELHEILVKEKVPAWYMGSKGMDQNTVKNDFGWGSPKFHKMGRDKIRLIRDFTKVGLDVLISDIDVAWLEDPIPYFRRHPRADMLVSTDQLRNESKGDNLEFHICQTACNIGIMWIRSTKGTQDLTQQWLDKIEKDPQIWDQVAFNQIKELGGSCTGKRDADGLMKAFHGKVNMGVLPVTLFSNGHTFYVQKLQDRLDPGLHPYAVHATFQYGGTPGKRHRMREAGVWLGDETTYFEHRGGFLSYEPHIPEDMDMSMFKPLGWPSHDGQNPTLTKQSPLLHEHMKLVNYQLAQFRDALAVAWLTGRRLIAPSFLCGLDRVWFPHYGRFPGSILYLPFECPLDHVIRIEHVYRFSKGGKLPFLEHSFLSNPELPDPPSTVNQVIITSNGPQTGKPAWESDKQQDKRVPGANKKILPMNMDAHTLQEELRTLKEVKYLHFTSMVGMFKGFDDKAMGHRFASQNAVDPNFGDEWCCTQQGPMRYDFLGSWKGRI